MRALQTAVVPTIAIEPTRRGFGCDLMKSAIKYGGIIAAGAAIWVLADHFVLHISRPGSIVTPLLFNLLQLTVIFAGIRVLRRQNDGCLTTDQGIWHGLAISLAYAVFSLIFFLAFYLIVGARALENEPAGSGDDHPPKYVLLGAFAGLFLGAMISGLIYSAVISYALRASAQSKSGRKARPPAARPARRR
jgi:hypothetical protein